MWSSAENEEALLRPGTARRRAVPPTWTASDSRRRGVNLLQSARALPPCRACTCLRTLLPEAAAKSDWRYLGGRRLALFLMASIERGTRWACSSIPGPALWARVRSQVMAFFARWSTRVLSSDAAPRRIIS